MQDGMHHGSLFLSYHLSLEATKGVCSTCFPSNALCRTSLLVVKLEMCLLIAWYSPNSV